MKKYLEFVIDKIDDSKYYLICITRKGLQHFYKKIERYLRSQNFVGDLYVDQLTSVSTGYNRFAIIPFKGNELDFGECEHLPLGDEFKKLTSNLFYTHPEYIGKYNRIPDYILEKFAKNEPA